MKRRWDLSQIGFDIYIHTKLHSRQENNLRLGLNIAEISFYVCRLSACAVKVILFLSLIMGQLPDDWTLIKLLGACEG